MSRAAGPRQPPAAGRFHKGQSGNPKGRPKGQAAKPGSAFDIVIDKTLTVTHAGKPREVTVEEALQHRTYQDAVAGNRAARREVLKMVAKREQYRAARSSASATRFEFRREIDPENADTALLILGLACRNPHRQGSAFDGEQLLLETWAVQMAMSRRRGGDQLSDKKRTEVRRFHACS